mmetsp:Transcript_36194/g.116221  ORF Transcript_36194/g.116221 Transcript_36194/m.116221 type:complete len:280 (+) Transcript_36194:271-1110(+)
MTSFRSVSLPPSSPQKSTTTWASWATRSSLRSAPRSSSTWTRARSTWTRSSPRPSTSTASYTRNGTRLRPRLRRRAARLPICRLTSGWSISSRGWSSRRCPSAPTRWSSAWRSRRGGRTWSSASSCCATRHRASMSTTPPPARCSTTASRSSHRLWCPAPSVPTCWACSSASTGRSTRPTTWGCAGAWRSWATRLALRPSSRRSSSHPTWRRCSCATRWPSTSSTTARRPSWEPYRSEFSQKRRCPPRRPRRWRLSRANPPQRRSLGFSSFCRARRSSR